MILSYDFNTALPMLCCL